MLTVSENKRHLLKDGKPWFWLGDTAWHLAHYLTLEEATHYFGVRHQQGFNLSMFVLLAENDALTRPNRQGDFPLHDQDPAKPNEKFFAHIDQVVEACNDHNIVAGLLPTWGCYWNPKWASTPTIFNPTNARTYGKFLGERYKDKKLVWILGGDRPVENEAHLQILRAMAEGLAEGDKNAHLMAYHVSGGSLSTDFTPQEAWLDIDSFQTGHMKNGAGSDAYIDRGYPRQPTRPILELEPAYENHPQMLEGWVPDKDRFNAWRVRRDFYTAILAGACGHTYGCHDIWQMHDPKTHPIINESDTPWQKALNLPGASQLQAGKSFFEKNGFPNFTPAQQIITEGQGEDLHRARLATTPNGALLYLPSPRPIKLDRPIKNIEGFDPVNLTLLETNSLTDLSTSKEGDLLLRLTFN